MKTGLSRRREKQITASFAPSVSPDRLPSHLEVRDTWPCCLCCSQQPRECVDTHRDHCPEHQGSTA